MGVVDAVHFPARGDELVVTHDVHGLFRGQLDAFADDVGELAHGEFGGDEELAAVEGGEGCLGGPLNDHGDAVGVAFADAFGLGFALVQGKLFDERSFCIQKHHNVLMIRLHFFRPYLR